MRPCGVSGARVRGRSPVAEERQEVQASLRDAVCLFLLLPLVLGPGGEQKCSDKSKYILHYT